MFLQLWLLYLNANRGGRLAWYLSFESQDPPMTFASSFPCLKLCSWHNLTRHMLEVNILTFWWMCAAYLIWPSSVWNCLPWRYLHRPEKADWAISFWILWQPSLLISTADAGNVNIHCICLFVFTYLQGPATTYFLTSLAIEFRQLQLT